MQKWQQMSGGAEAASFTSALPLALQLSSVEAGGATAFIYGNFSVPVVKVSGG